MAHGMHGTASPMVLLSYFLLGKSGDSGDPWILKSQNMNRNKLLPSK